MRETNLSITLSSILGFEKSRTSFNAVSIASISSACAASSETEFNLASSSFSAEISASALWRKL